MGVAVYDRSSRKSRILFTSKGMFEQGSETKPVMMRSQWLADGKHVVINWMPLTDSADAKSVATFAMLPLGGAEPVRLLHLGGLKDSSEITLFPLALVGTRAFLNAESNIITLDLLTGETRVLTNTQTLTVYASPVPGRFGFMAPIAGDRMECGLLNPETMTKEWRVEREENKALRQLLLRLQPSGQKGCLHPRSR